MYSLRPFTTTPSANSAIIKANCTFSKLDVDFDLVNLEYYWDQNLQPHDVPAKPITYTDLSPNLSLSRADQLWKNTCFEAFFEHPLKTGQIVYDEINLSAYGKWNAYRFTKYREPYPPSATSDWQIIELSFKPGKLMAKLKVSGLNTPLKYNLCCIFCTPQNTNDPLYFAYKHSLLKPDFHDRSVWSLIKETP